MYAQAAIKPNTLLRNGAYGIVMRGVQKCTCAGASLRSRNSAPLCCIKLDTATDPCMGSGHILCYLFDVLVQIYEAYGYSVREAVKLIVEKNLYGLDLDERAGQLGYFAVMMKARQYDRRFFSRDVQPNIGHFQGLTFRAEDFSDPALQSLVKAFENADEYGSLLEISEKNLDIEVAANAVDAYTDNFLTGLDAREKLLRMVQLARILSQKYDVVVTNPPYMGASNMDETLNIFIKNHYADYKSDFFSAFIVRVSKMTKATGYCGFFIPYVWMFIQSYEKLRHYMYDRCTLETLIQFEYSAFEEATVPVCTFAFKNSQVERKKGAYLRLTDFRSGMEVQRQKTLEAINNHQCGFYFEQTSDNFAKIPGAPVAYWVSERVFNCFTSFDTLGNKNTLLAGTSTGDNTQYQRMWYEVVYSTISRNAPNDTSKRWYPCNTGGEFRKYTLNPDVVIDWENDGYRIRNHRNAKGKIGSAIRNRDYYFRKGITWNKLSSSNFGVRIVPEGYISDDTARMIVTDENNQIILLGFLCSKVCKYFLQILSPTMSFTNSELQRLPLNFCNKETEIENYTRDNIDLSELDRNSFETSWDFQRHPLL